MTEIVRCPSCDGYGWIKDLFTDNTEDCSWCKRTGYVYQDGRGIQRPIPDTDYPHVKDTLEQLETERLREMGYTGEAKAPWRQAVRRGTKGGIPPEERDS